MVYGKIKEVRNHENADSLKVCMVDVWEHEDIQIVCWGSNLNIGQWVAIAKIGASVVWHGQGDPVIMKKTSIRWIESYGMICASEEIWLADIYPAKIEAEILDLTHLNVIPGTPLAEALGKDDSILEIDNKAINHRPDLFSHIGIAREVAAIAWENFPYEYTSYDFSQFPDAGVKNYVPESVNRYMACYISGVKNVESPQDVLDVIASHWVTPKGILVDISNYSLYLYGQPTHCFDADKLTGDIHIRYAQDAEEFIALNDKTYTLSSDDIVIADDAWVIALWGIIGWKASAVTDATTRIVIESAHFNQAVVRKTGKRLGLRTDALNIFEKNISLHLQPYGLSLIVSELKKIFSEIQIERLSDTHLHLPEVRHIPQNHEYIRKIIWAEYNDLEMESIFLRLGIIQQKWMYIIPHWRTDIEHLTDLAEEIARVTGYNTIETTVPRVQLWAVTQSILYKARRDIRNFLSARGYFEMYTYSFVYETLMKKCLSDTKNCVWLKNTLSEELSHMRPSLIPNLLASLELNIRDFQDLKLFECEKIFQRHDSWVQEFYELSMIIHHSTTEENYYTIVQEFEDIAHKLQMNQYELRCSSDFPSYAHNTRIAEIFVRGQSVWFIGEIHPQVLNNFSLSGRVGFLSLHLDLIKNSLYTTPKYYEISTFQANSFDLTFVVDRSISWKKIQQSIQKTHILIKKVELFSIYESEEKFPGKRALSFTVTIQSFTETLNDQVKNTLIQEIISRVEKLWAKLR